jgi:BASS family bile acid:Na+ symporter
METTLLPIALGLIMLGLGLSLTMADFARVAKHPKAVAIALVCQVVILPVICFGLVELFNLPPVLAVGMMLLAASPGGTTANLYSHLFRGDVALNISLTAINSVLSVFTLPIVVNLAINYFAAEGDRVGLQFQKTLEVFAIVLIPVFVGMMIRRWRESFAMRMDKPVRVASAVILALVIVGAVIANLDILLDNFAALAGITALFCALSLTIGYFVPRMFSVTEGESIATAFEVGIHNATLAIVVAQSVLLSTEMSLPAAIYGVLMFFIAAGFGLLIKRRAQSNAQASVEVV